MQTEDWRALTPAQKVAATLLNHNFYSKPAFEAPDGSTLQFWSRRQSSDFCLVHEFKGGAVNVYAPICDSGHIDDILHALKRRCA